MLWGEWEEELAAGRDAVADAEAFYDVPLDVPDYEKTVFVNHYSHDEKTVRLDPMSADARHETRHAIHHAIVEHVAERNMAELAAYYEEELADLSVQPFFSGLAWAPSELYDRITGSNRLQRRYDDMICETGEAEQLATGIYEVNQYTNVIQQEYFAENSTLLYRATPAAVSAMGAGTTTSAFSSVADTMQAGADVGAYSPEILAAIAVGGVLAAGISCSTGNLVYRGCNAESLTESNISDLDDPVDRQRVLLYNSEVADTLDDFLNVLDEYGIE